MGAGVIQHYNPRTAITTDITDYVDRESFEVEFQANQLNSLASMKVVDDLGVLDLRERDEVYVLDDAVRIFGGQIATLAPDISGAGVTYTVKCQGFDCLLDQRVIESGSRTGSRFDDDDVAWIASFGADLGLDGTTFVSRLRTLALPDIDYTDESPLTLRRALNRLGGYTTGYTYWVDANKAIHWTDPVSAQLVANGDFEGGATDWSLDAAASVDGDSGPGGTGDSALVVVGDGSGTHPSFQVVSSIVGDRRYMIFADLFATVDGEAELTITWRDASLATVGTTSLTHAGGDSAWDRQEAIATAPASATSARIDLAVASGSSATARFDNVNLIGEDAAFGVSTNPNGTTTRRMFGWKQPTDATTPINRVWVQGDGIGDWREHAASIAYYGQTFEGVYSDDRVTTSDGIDSRAAFVFRKSAFPTISGSYKTDQSGLDAGTWQIIEVVRGSFVVTAIQWLATIKTHFDGNDNMEYAVTYGAPEDDIGSVLAAVGSAFTGDTDIGVDSTAIDIPGSDSTAPSVPTGLAVNTGTTQAADGTDRPFLLASWDANADVDLNAYEIEIDRAIEGEITFVAAASGTGGALPAGDYAVQVTGEGIEGGETAPISDPQVVTVTAGQRLFVNITAKAGCDDFKIYASILTSGETQPQDTGQTTTTTGSDVEVTAAGAGAVYPPTTSTAVSFINPTASRTGAVSFFVEAVGGLYYAVRLRAIDDSGNASAFTAPQGTIIGDDTIAPSIPASVALSTGHGLIGVRWERPSDRDIAVYEVRWAPESTVTPDTPDTDAWDVVSTLTNWALITGLDAGSADGATPATTYFVQVRAIDRSGNVRTSAIDSTAVDANSNPEAGWSNDGTNDAYLSAAPVLLSGADVAYGSIVSDHLSAEGIDAGFLTAGTIAVGGVPNTPDFLLVYDADGNEIGRWDADGLTVIDPADPNLRMRFVNGVLSFSTDGGTTWTTAISGEGISADAITLGTAPGGHNAVLNSSFELAEFATPLDKVWTAAADWGTTIGTDVNVVKTGTSLTLTDATF